jgi:hypothetical protein
MNSKYQEIANDVVHHLEYNGRSHLIIPEYGGICKMIVQQSLPMKSVIKQQSILFSYG